MVQTIKPRHIRNILLTLAVVALAVGLFLICFGRAIPSCMKIDTVSDSKAVTLNMDSALYYRQTLNNCGPYSVMAVVNILTEQKLDPEILAKEMRWRIIKNLTFPQGVVDLLRSYSVESKEFVLKNRTDDEKAVFLRNRIDEGCPVILLIKVHHIQHYVTVLGYDENGFMLYDSMQEKNPQNFRMTVTDARCSVGNRYYTERELLDLWDAGGFKAFFKNWAVVCSVK